ncbi:single-stranded nucleic acid binding R3H [Lineolata rhizophorae]|uniref:Single-stranded nucleic acid binding R3H n=1 Tax=Lineolata rhizophorae TaxID=578093 RepID=A0A6A6PC22_9PEZI|nr:single-stranded nucleic acid binding R3H [Lineolata rhizophorae]
MAAPGTVVAAGEAEPGKPDVQLLEALFSPRDRLFVLKLEQDIIDFINNSNESKLDLPSCNSFYRMLAHRLATYYSLEHPTDDSLKAVRLLKRGPISDM